MTSTNLFKGNILSDNEFKDAFYLQKSWLQDPLPRQVLFAALEKVSLKLQTKDELYRKLFSDLEKRDDIKKNEIEIILNSLIDFISIDQLRKKLKRELGSEYPFELRRISSKEDHFEAWYPQGVLVHVTPNNSPLLSTLGVIEGLLSGNVNVLKLARKESAFATIFFKALIEADSTQALSSYIAIAKISSKDQKYLSDVLSIADVISAWGNEESLKSLKNLAPSHARFIEWGHKISFSYVSQNSLDDEEMFKSLAKEICIVDQLACSSPQCVFLEDAHFSDLEKFAQKLSHFLDEEEKKNPPMKPSLEEQAEITVVSEQVRLNSVDGQSKLIKSKNNSWRLYLDLHSTLNASPLYRTLWIKPMPKNKLVENLSPLKTYLQTAGIWCLPSELEELGHQLFKAGVQRIHTIGEMLDSYIGEPHDGVYALERYCKRISLMDGKDKKNMVNKFSFEEKHYLLPKDHSPIMEKSDFQNQKVEDSHAQMFFYSGGSSGEPKLSVFTYEDYHRQMQLAADGLYAAGFDSKIDRAMNLFYAGSLYGGFVSFFTILEKLEATQFPMGASSDFEMVGTAIIKNNVNTLLGMPSYLMQLFAHNEKRFKEYRGIKKIFFGGEHFSELQRKYLIDTFGVEFVRSASYGSVDAGPLGYQCPHCTGGIHHLHTQLLELEVVELEKDAPAAIGEVGRFLFTSKVRHGQKIHRYAIGDVGKILEGECLCGRKGVRFELLGRHGDVFRIGTVFLSYQRFEKILSDKIVYDGSFQLHLYPRNSLAKEKVIILMEKPNKSNVSESELLNVLVSTYPDLTEATITDKVLDFEVKYVARENLTLSPTTGKLKSVIDHRMT
jgi:phenylacetate-coenzyme A ligase PaaK-like adenylate-forming protein